MLNKLCKTNLQQYIFIITQEHRSGLYRFKGYNVTMTIHTCDCNGMYPLYHNNPLYNDRLAYEMLISRKPK